MFKAQCQSVEQYFLFLNKNCIQLKQQQEHNHTLRNTSTAYILYNMKWCKQDNNEDISTHNGNDTLIRMLY